MKVVQGAEETNVWYQDVERIRNIILDARRMDYNYKNISVNCCLLTDTLEVKLL